MPRGSSTIEHRFLHFCSCFLKWSIQTSAWSKWLPFKLQIQHSDSTPCKLPILFKVVRCQYLRLMHHNFRFQVFDEEMMMQHGLKRSSLGYNWNMFSYSPFFNIQIILICWIDWQSVHCAHRPTIWCFCMPTQNKNRSFFYAFIINVFPRYWRQIRWRILLTKNTRVNKMNNQKLLTYFC